jgi:hypothetical protein
MLSVVLRYKNCKTIKKPYFWRQQCLAFIILAKSWPMKIQRQHLWTILWSCCQLLVFLQPLSAQNDRCALLVGVSNYSERTGWPRLAAGNDVRIVQGALLEHGFTDKQIHTLLDREATKDGILKAIRAHLANKAKPGGLAVFHFSGHGQQIQDDDGDEIDGLDEALVPYDSPMRYTKGVYEGQNLLRDDELGEALRQVRKKLGKEGLLLVTIDACHSGTATRSAEVTARGTNIIMADPAYLQQLQTQPRAADPWLERNRPDEQDMAPIVALFSSSANEPSAEIWVDGQQYGAFSHALCKGIHRLPSDATYRSLMEQVRLEMSSSAPEQTPTHEGAIDRVLFGQGFLPAPVYFRAIERLGPKQLLLNAGTIQGLHIKSRLALYPPGTTDTAGLAPLALGLVDQARLAEARVALDRPLDRKIALGARVFLQERSYGLLHAKVQLRFPDAELQQALRTQLETFPFLSVSDGDADLYVERSPSLAGARLGLYPGSNLAPLWDSPIPEPAQLEQTARSMADAAGKYLRANYLRTLEHDHPSIQAELRLFKKMGDGAFQRVEPAEVLRVGDEIRIEIHNTGQEEFYFRLYDVDAKHDIFEVQSPKANAADEQLLRPGSSDTVATIIDKDTPPGKEVLKIIATRQALQTDILRGQGAYQHPLEALLTPLVAEGALSQERGEAVQAALPAMSGFIGSLVVEVGE